MESIRPFFFFVAQGCFLIDKKHTNFRILWCAPRIPSSTFWCWKKVLKPRYNVFVVDLGCDLIQGMIYPRTQPTTSIFEGKKPSKTRPELQSKQGSSKGSRYISLPSLRIVSEHTTTSLKIGEKRLHGCRGPRTAKKTWVHPRFSFIFRGY